MAQPTASSITVYTDVETVKSSLGIGPYDTADDQWLALSVDAANCAVAYWRPDLSYSRCNPRGITGQVGAQFDPAHFVPTDYAAKNFTALSQLAHYQGAQFSPNQYQTGVKAWMYRGDPMLTWGATQLAGRWYRRRGAEDTAAFAEFGGPPPSIDKDIEVSLGIGRHYRPVVG